MVAHPAEYHCSSYQYNALGKSIELITPHSKQQIEKQTGRRASPLKRGGDRKSEKYRANS